MYFNRCISLGSVSDTAPSTLTLPSSQICFLNWFTTPSFPIVPLPKRRDFGLPSASFILPPSYRRINYWLQFLESHHLPDTTPPHIIIIASHKDILKKQLPESYKAKISAFESFAKNRVILSTSLHFAGFFAIDCRYVSIAWSAKCGRGSDGQGHSFVYM